MLSSWDNSVVTQLTIEHVPERKNDYFRPFFSNPNAQIMIFLLFLRITRTQPKVTISY